MKPRFKRRLILALLWLIALDQFVPSVVERLERNHYEGTTTFRFENSDLFALGPLVEYLRDHARHSKPRVMFLGNSMIFGYFLNAQDAMPAQYQRLRPDTHVYNAAVNGQEIGMSYLIAEDVIDSVDVMYVQVVGEKANPMLPSLIPIDDADLRRFELSAPNGVEQQMQSWLGRVWHLYGLNYRLQAALFGTSTRVFIYMHKTDLARLLHAKAPEAPWQPITGQISLRAPRRIGRVLSATPQQRIKNDLAALAVAKRKRVVFLEFEWDNNADDDEVAAFNAHFAPYAETVIVHVPRSVTFDGQHPVPASARQIAEALAQHEASR